MSARKAKGGKKFGCLGIIGVTVGGIVVLAAIGAALGGGEDADDSSSPVAFSGQTPEVQLPEGDLATIVSITDGDTIDTSLGTVRLIGIDTPEQGQCGVDEATRELAKHLPIKSEVILTLPDGQNDTDRHNRLLRYVTTEQGVDVGLELIKTGHAIARYDSSDGYPAHPEEETYRAAERATLSDDGTVMTVSCALAAEKAAQEAAEAERVAAEQAAAQQTAAEAEAARAAEEAASAAAWWTQYGSCSMLKKNSAGHPTGPFNVNDPAEVEIYNWFQYGTGHRGDGDGDGLACE